jgi:hypothetical protein
VAISHQPSHPGPELRCVNSTQKGVKFSLRNSWRLRKHN